MTIGTDDKLKNSRTSEKGRVKSGAKGIGRFALNKLGRQSSMITFPEVGNKGYYWTIDWSDFDKDGYNLSDIKAELGEVDNTFLVDKISEYPSINAKKFSLDLWESNKDFYENLFKYYFKKILNVDKPKINNLPKSSFAINGLLKLLNYLLTILENKKEAYMNEKIKFIINILCEILTGKSKTIINNGVFYEGSILELKTIYKDIQYNEYELIEKTNIFYKDKALKKIEKVKNDLFDYIIEIFETSTFNLTENLNNEINTKMINNESNEENNKTIEELNMLENKLKNIKQISVKFKQMKGNCKNT
jgi:hypothetical protein